MTKNEVIEYIKKNGDEQKVIETVKAMHLEGAPMTIKELDRRMHPMEDMVNALPDEIFTDNKPEAPLLSELSPEYERQQAIRKEIDQEYASYQPQRDVSEITDLEYATLKPQKQNKAATGCAVLIAIMLVLLMGVILIMQLLPNSGITFYLDSTLNQLRDVNSSALIYGKI